MMNDLPIRFADEVASFPKYSMETNRMRVTLRDGTEFSDVFVAWAKEIVRVGSNVSIPVDPSEIVRVINQI